MTDAVRPMLVNVERLHRYMEEAGCTAIVARSGRNFTDLSGVAYPGTLGRHLDFPDTPRDVFCICRAPESQWSSPRMRAMRSLNATPGQRASS